MDRNRRASEIPENLEHDSTPSLIELPTQELPLHAETPCLSTLTMMEEPLLELPSMHESPKQLPGLEESLHPKSPSIATLSLLELPLKESPEVLSQLESRSLHTLSVVELPLPAVHPCAKQQKSKEKKKEKKQKKAALALHHRCQDSASSAPPRIRELAIGSFGLDLVPNEDTAAGHINSVPHTSDPVALRSFGHEPAQTKQIDKKRITMEVPIEDLPGAQPVGSAPVQPSNSDIERHVMKSPKKKVSTKKPQDPWSAPGVVVDKMVWNHHTASYDTNTFVYDDDGALQPVRSTTFFEQNRFRTENTLLTQRSFPGHASQ
jgi:hypothetical protein